MAMHETDTLIAVGARFDDRVTGQIAQFCPNATIIHIDIDPLDFEKRARGCPHCGAGPLGARGYVAGAQRE